MARSMHRRAAVDANGSMHRIISFAGRVALGHCTASPTAVEAASTIDPYDDDIRPYDSMSVSCV
jgi:hypothetical protein